MNKTIRFILTGTIGPDDAYPVCRLENSATLLVGAIGVGVLILAFFGWLTGRLH